MHQLPICKKQKLSNTLRCPMRTSTFNTLKKFLIFTKKKSREHFCGQAHNKSVYNIFIKQLGAFELNNVQLGIQYTLCTDRQCILLMTYDNYTLIFQIPVICELQPNVQKHIHLNRVLQLWIYLTIISFLYNIFLGNNLQVKQSPSVASVHTQITH